SFAHQVKLTKHLSLFGIAEAYHNNALKLYLQQSYGGGLGTTMRSADKRQVLELLGDVRFFGQHFYSDKPTAAFTGVRIGEDYSLLIPIGGKFILCFEKINYIHPINLKDAWQIRGTMGLDVPITDIFSVSFQFNDDYFQNVANGRKNYSKTALGFKF